MSFSINKFSFRQYTFILFPLICAVSFAFSAQAQERTWSTDAPKFIAPGGPIGDRRTQFLEVLIKTSALSSRRIDRYLGTAMALYWLHPERKAEADALLEKFADEYPPIDRDMDSEKDQFHWNSNRINRVLFLFGSHGSLKPGLISPAAENKLKELLWKWAEPRGEMDVVDPRKDWWVWGSENHHLMSWAGMWSTLSILSKDPAYANRKFHDGSTVSQLKPAYDAYFKRWLSKRAMAGMFLECNSPTYTKYSLYTIYGLADFADDPQLRKLATNFLDLFWAQWALEEVNGIRGGSRHRSYPGWPSISNNDGSSDMAWYHFGVGLDELGTNPGVWAAATTSYVPSPLVTKIAKDRQQLGSYETMTRLPGLLISGGKDSDQYADNPRNPLNTKTRRYSPIDPTFPSLVRKSYITPEFTMGASMLPCLPWDSWASVSAQNRLDPVIFTNPDSSSASAQAASVAQGREGSDADGDGNGDGAVSRARNELGLRLFLRPRRFKTLGSVMNNDWSVIDKGVMITQRLDSARSAEMTEFWFPSSLRHLEKGGWVFVEAPLAYAAVKVVDGEAKWAEDTIYAYHQKGDFRPGRGEWLVPDDNSSPFVIEVAPKAAYADMAAFQKEILSNKLVRTKGRVDYSSHHYGNKLTLFSDFTKVPLINDISVNLNPAEVYGGHLNAETGGDEVTLEAFGEKEVFKFDGANAVAP